jgi:hypothetical protein
MPTERRKRASTELTEEPTRVNFERVIRQGLLYKRGTLLKMYSNQYHFYLESRDELRNRGPYLKFGRKGKAINSLIDLSAQESNGVLNGIMALKQAGAKFKIITSTQTLHLKADNRQERDKWIEAIMEASSNAMVLTMRDRVVS